MFSKISNKITDSSIMQTDEYSDKESYEERSPDDSPTNIKKKSLSMVGFRLGAETRAPGPLGPLGPLALRATQSLIESMEEVRLSPARRNSQCKLAPSCPCGCLLRPAAAGPFRTRDRNTLALYVVAPDVLAHHGYCYEPEQIAMFWKKDCRMFLWKGKSKNRDVVHVDPYK